MYNYSCASIIIKPRKRNVIVIIKSGNNGLLEGSSDPSEAVTTMFGPV